MKKCPKLAKTRKKNKKIANKMKAKKTLKTTKKKIIKPKRNNKTITISKKQRHPKNQKISNIKALKILAPTTIYYKWNLGFKENKASL